MHKEIGDNLDGVELRGTDKVQSQDVDYCLAEARKDCLDKPHKQVYDYKIFGNGGY